MHSHFRYGSIRLLQNNRISGIVLLVQSEVCDEGDNLFSGMSGNVNVAVSFEVEVVSG